MSAPVIPVRLSGRGYLDWMPRRLPLINSAIAFALALLVMITLHELGHGVMALGFGFRPVIHASTETDPAPLRWARRSRSCWRGRSGA